MKVLSLSVLAGVMAAPAFGCDLCAIYSASEANAVAGRGFYGGVFEQFTHFGTLQEDGHKIPNDGEYIDSSISQVFAGYNINNRFGLQFNLPVIYRSFGSSTEHGSTSGIGDVSLVGNVRLYEKLQENFTFNWLALGGIKFPTGDPDRLGGPDFAAGIGGHDLALGSGSFDGIVGTGFSARWKRLLFTGSMQYAARTKGSFGHQYADDFTWFGGPGMYLALGHQYTLSLQAVISGETKDKDTFSGVPDDDSAETIVYAGPQLNFTWSNRLSAQLGADLPVSIDNTGVQVVPDYRIRVGFTWRF